MTSESATPARSDPSPAVRLEVLDRLIEHLTTGGSAIVTGARGLGLGQAVRVVTDDLVDDGIHVHQVTLSPGLSTVPDLHLANHGSTRPRHRGGADLTSDVIVLDARRCPEAAAVRAAIASATAAGHLFLLVCPHDPDWDDALEVGRSHGALTFVLRPWSVDDIRAVLEARGLGSRDARQVASFTGGLPWLMHHLRPSAEDDPLATGRDAPDPSRVAAFVMGLLDACSPEVADATLALAVGYPVTGSPALPGAPADDPAAQERLVRSVEGAGLLGADGNLPPLIRDCLIHFAPPHRLQRWRNQLIEDLLRAGQDLAPVSPDLVGQGVRDPRVVEALVGRAFAALDDHSPDHPHVERLLQLCTQAGSADPRVSLIQAHLGLLHGDVGAAARAIDHVLVPGVATVPAGLVPLGLQIAWAQDLPHRAADLVRWVADRDQSAALHPLVAVSRYLVGDMAGGDVVLSRTASHTDAAVSGSQLLAEALRTSLVDPAAALPQLMLAVEAGGDDTPALTDSPAALVALWGLNAGDLALVDSVIHSVQHHQSLGPITRQRLRVLSAWAQMTSGRIEEAQSTITDIGEVSARDRLWLTALHVGLARRADDPLALRAAWASAREVVLRHPVSLGQLLPLGELALVAARMRDFDLVRAQWDQSLRLLSALGEPALWSAPFHWYAVQVALQQDDPKALAPHASALARAGATWGHASVLSAAGRTWVKVRARDVDPDEVERTVRRMVKGGLAWDAARLGAHGAAASRDRRASTRLLECAREALPRGVMTATEATHGATPEELNAHPVDTGLQLTEREWQVAELVVAGRTYKQVGEILYLSPKTVEHHVARIRRRSGAGSRSELLELLLAAVSSRAASRPSP